LKLEVKMYNQTPKLEPIIPQHHISLLDDGQLADLKNASIQILDEIGFHCPSEKALAIYAEHGGVVDFDEQLVKLSPGVVEKAMETAPRFYTMGARGVEFDLTLDGTALYCATDGCGVETIDFETRQRRNSCKDDIAKMARVTDFLSSVGFYWPLVSAQDFPATAPLHELDASFNNTVKHVQTETVMDEEMARFAVEMATVVSGDRQKLRERPVLSSLICTISPLAQDKGGLEAGLVFAESGIPVGFMSMANVGSTGPATIAGTLAQADAEIVAAMVLMQMAHPGAPVYHSMMPGVMHPRTGAFLGTTWECGAMYAYGVEMAHNWGVPTLAGVFGTDAQVPGWQQASEAATPLMLCAMCGAETGAGLGLTESCTLLYPEAIILDADVYQRVRIELAGLDTSQEILALEVIKDVGPRGHYLSQKHTRTHMRQRLFSDVVAQPAPEGTYRDPVEVARERVTWILENHQPQPLEDAQKSELTSILSKAKDQFGA
jgi:trimethylamine--corrinoid protein Co-methyltransferase